MCIALSVVLSLRFLHFPDLTIDGTVATSGAVFAVVLVATGSSTIAFAAAIGSGFLCGLLTMFLHERLGIGKLLSGILVFSGLYSIDLRIMSGSNASILGVSSWMDLLNRWEVELVGETVAFLNPLVISCLLVGIGTVFGAVLFFYRSRPGIIIRGIGDNERAVSRMSISSAPYKYFGLGLANALAGLGAALMVSNQGFADVSMGAGSLVLGLAALIIGERIVGQFWKDRDLVSGLLLAAFVGTAVYQSLWLLVLRCGLSPTDLKLFTAVLVVVSFVSGRWAKPFYEGRSF